MYLDILYHVHYLGAFAINHGEGCATLYVRPVPPHRSAYEDNVSDTVGVRARV